MTTLQVTSSDFHQSTNCVAHRTNDYTSKTLIVRRGDPFTVTLKINRAVTPKDKLMLWAETGPSRKNSKIMLPISSSDCQNCWSATVKSESNESIEVIMNSPSDAAIGRYLMGVQVTSGRSKVFQNVGEFILLFNAWNPADAVYMEDEAGRKEYVLNDNGIIYYGNARENPASRKWDYGQFEENVADICIKMMDSSVEYRRSPASDIKQRGDPAYVGRVLSAMVNSQGDKGILVGNWSGDYTGGERPTSWNGSVKILKQWDKDGPVQYGQCWVYGGVLCTVLRCLGFPARVVTNFASAHDTDESLTIDRYFDVDGNEISDHDSVWNFHVWNEAWFARRDLQTNIYDGWQVLDATPQEPSGGSYRLGPCPVKAIKGGDVDVAYDAPFVFTEVNGDRVTWMLDGGERKMISIDTNSIGKFTSTKAVGTDKRADITNDYKFPEDSVEERNVVTKAKKKMESSSSFSADSSRRRTVAFSARDAEPVPKPDFEAVFSLSGDPEVGQDVKFNLKLKSTSAAKSNVQVKMTAYSIVYTNTQVKEILQEVQSVVLEPKEEKQVPLTIIYACYENAITTDNMIKVTAVCEDERGGKLLAEGVVKLKPPSIVIKAVGEGHVDKPLTLEIAFTNPLSEVVENCVLTVEGSGLIRDSIKIEIPSLQKNQQSVTKLEIVPYRSGKRNVMVDLFADKFSDVKGTLPINVC